MFNYSKVQCITFNTEGTHLRVGSSVKGATEVNNLRKKI